MDCPSYTNMSCMTHIMTYLHVHESEAHLSRQTLTPTANLHSPECAKQPELSYPFLVPTVSLPESEASCATSMCHCTVLGKRNIRSCDVGIFPNLHPKLMHAFST